ncbi:phosphoric ester hydrolase-like protein [Cenococcum geophilum]
MCPSVPKQFIKTKQAGHVTTIKNFFREPTQFGQFQWSPLKYTTRALYHILSALRAPVKLTNNTIRIICISDTYNSTPLVPNGDVLIHAGDLTENSTLLELQAHIDRLSSLLYTHKVVIAGNHDTYLDPQSRAALFLEDRINYLQSTSLTLTFPSHDNRVLNTNTIPSDTNILITHSPPRNYHYNPRALPLGRMKPCREYAGWDAGQAAYDRAAIKRQRITRNLLSGGVHIYH